MNAESSKKRQIDRLEKFGSAKTNFIFVVQIFFDGFSQFSQNFAGHLPEFRISDWIQEDERWSRLNVNTSKLLHIFTSYNISPIDRGREILSRATLTLALKRAAWVLRAGKTRGKGLLQLWPLWPCKPVVNGRI
jgi:hypothetical protein